MKNAMQLKAIMKKLAKENQISAQLVLQNYMLERFLERVSLSPYRDNYIIKGGFLISSMVGLNSRATMDMDATIKGYPVTQDTVQKMIEKILTVPVDDDITFTFKSIGEIREGDEYTGYRVALTADFPPMAVPLKLDITTGDKITPREIQYDYKLMLEDRHIQVMAYNLATILAEKLETVISRSDQNTRPRDYYDVYILTKLQAKNIDFPALGAALMATASKRGSDSILQDYRAIVEAVRNSEIMRRQWDNYRKDFDYASTISIISAFYQAFRSNKYVSMAMAGMLAGVAAVIFDVVINMAWPILKKKRLLPIAVMLAAFVATRFFSVNIILIILVCGVIGALDTLYLQKKEVEE